MDDRAAEHATYLWVAETVLRRHQRPLNARQIVTLGLDDGLFADQDISRTPQKSMQARLSIDILAKGNGSRFLRTGRGKFYLRDLYLKGAIKPGEDSHLEEYTAIRHVPTAPSEQVLVVPQGSYVSVLDFQGINTSPDEILAHLIKNSNGITHIPRTEAETNSSFKQFITYTIIQQRDKILTFRRGQYNRAASFLRGARCIGFGGHVTEDDLNIFTFGDRGIKANAAREISEEVKLASGRPEIDPNELEILGLLNDDSSDVGVRHIGVVLRYWAPETDEWRHPQRGEASITQLRWMKTTGAEIDLLEFEYWSQLCLRTFYPTFVTNRPSFRIIKRTAFQERHILCVLGSIGSGKSITTDRLCSRAGYTQINTGRVVARLLGIPPVPETPRPQLQVKAFDFIKQPDGPKLLAKAILDEASNINSHRIIIDGVRQLHTLEAIKDLSSLNVATIFVYTPPDIAYQLYSTREAGIDNLSLSDFMRIYNAPVEAEVRHMIQEADAIIYNWFGLESYELVVEKLLAELGL